MRAGAELMLSDITVGAENLKPSRPFVVSKESVQSGSTANLSPMFSPAAADVIDGEESPVGLPAAQALVAVGGNDLLSKMLGSFGSLLVAGRAARKGGQFLLTTITAQSSLSQFSLVSSVGSPILLSTLRTQFSRCVTLFAAIGASIIFHRTLIVSDCGGYIN